LPIM